ncbi:MAG: acyl-CoA dehydrogenase family protein [Candidatus Methanospirareceae archaeon]
MEFELREEQKMIKEMVGDFVEKEILPKAAEIEKKGEFPSDIMRKIAELKIFGLLFPKEYGGADAGMVAHVVAIEELSKGSAAIGFSASVGIGASFPIYFAGTEEQKEKYLRPLAEGSKLGAFAMTEPSAGSDPTSMETTATKEGDEYVLNGRKVFITNASVADIYVILAYTDKSKRAKGISAFIVEKGTEGFSFGKIEDMLGLRGCVIGELVFKDCKIPAENMLGKEGDGFKIAMATLDIDRTGAAGVAVGIAQACLEASKKYAKERKQFSQPLSNFQAIQFMIADMATQVEAARLLTYKAAYLADKGEAFSKEASMAKLYATEVALRAAVDAVQIHGGYGCTKDFPIERYLRDAKMLTIAVGTSEMQRIVIARNELRS